MILYKQQFIHTDLTQEVTMVTKAPNAVSPGDLPVRKVNIFGIQLVIPKDAFCQVEPQIVLNVLCTEHGLQACFAVKLQVFLRHAYIAKSGAIEATFLIYDESCSDRKVFRPRLKRVRREEWDEGSEKWERWYEYELTSRARDAIVKTVQQAQLVNAALDMYLAGTMKLGGLLPFLPQKPVFT